MNLLQLKKHPVHKIHGKTTFAALMNYLGVQANEETVVVAVYVVEVEVVVIQ